MEQIEQLRQETEHLKLRLQEARREGLGQRPDCQGAGRED